MSWKTGVGIVVFLTLLYLSVSTDITGFDNLFFFTAYAWLIFSTFISIIGLFVVAVSIYLGDDSKFVKTTSKKVIKTTNNTPILVFYNILDIFYIGFFVYQGWVVIAGLWLVYAILNRLSSYLLIQEGKKYANNH